MNSLEIQPINAVQKQQLVVACLEFIHLAEKLYQQDFTVPLIHFDLKGKTAGMYQVKKSANIYTRRIRINPWLAAKYFSETLNDTVPHEVAHYIVDCLYGLKNVRPHGPEWKQVMLDFGIYPQVRGAYSLEGIPVKQYQQFEYTCQCRSHWLTQLRHKKILNRKATYLCRSCGVQLKPALTA